MNKKNIALLVVVFFVGFILGQFLESLVYKQNGAVEELAWCKSELEKIYPPLEEEIYIIGGTVTEIGNDFIMVKSSVRISQFPLPNEEYHELQDIKVNLSEETEIFRYETMEDLTEQESEEEPDDPFEKVFLSIEDIKEDDSVDIYSEENIKGKEEFSASRIEVF